MRMPDPSRSWPSVWTVRPSGLMWALSFTTAETSSSTLCAETADAPANAKIAAASTQLGTLPTKQRTGDFLQGIAKGPVLGALLMALEGHPSAGLAASRRGFFFQSDAVQANAAERFRVARIAFLRKYPSAL